MAHYHFKNDELAFSFDQFEYEFYDSHYSWGTEIVTLTNETKGGWFGVQEYQLRFWDGEPDSFSPDHADSCGNGHLLATITSNDRGELVKFRSTLMEGETITKEEIINGVEVWRFDRTA